MQIKEVRNSLSKIGSQKAGIYIDRNRIVNSIQIQKTCEETQHLTKHQSKAMASRSAKSIFTSSPSLQARHPHPNSKSKSKSPLLSFLRNRSTDHAAARAPGLITISLKHSSNPSSSRCLAITNALKTTDYPRETKSGDLENTVSLPRPTILVSEKLGEAGLDLLRSFGNVDCSYDLSTEKLCEKISSCDALIVRSGTKVTRQVLEAAKGRLKVVGRAGVGIDNVDLQAATQLGCLVVNAPTANTVAAAEHAIALIAAMARNVAQADASMKAGN